MSAPASGLYEQQEASRKEIVVLRKAYHTYQSIKDKSTDRPQQGTAADLPQKPTTVRQPLRPSDYEEVGYNYEGLTEEQAKRLRQYEYIMSTPRESEAGRLNKRFSDFDYKSQW